MIFYEIKFKSQPQIKFALSATTDKYKNVYDKRQKFIEISVNEGATIEYDSSFGKFTSASKSMFLSMPDLSYRSRQLESGTVSMNTVAMTISDMSYIRHDCPDYNSAAAIINDPDRADAIFTEACFLSLPFLSNLRTPSTNANKVSSPPIPTLTPG